MTPTTFREQNGTLSGGPAAAYGTEDAVIDLPVHRDGMQIISCWRLLWLERLRLLFTGRVWLLVLATRTHPPVCLTAESPFAEPRGTIYGCIPWALLCVFAAILVFAGTCAWVEHDNHAVWMQHCVDRGSTAEACEKRWQKGEVQP